MKIGLVLSLDPQSGGMYQYTLSVVDSLRRWADEGGPEIALLWMGPNAQQDVVHPGWTEHQLKLGSVPGGPSWITEGAVRDLLRWVRRRLRRAGLDTVRDRASTRAEIQDMGIELLVFPAPNPLSFEIGLPFIMPVHDLQHRLQPDFPEVSRGGQWKQREYLYRNAARHAVFLVVDSDVGKEDALDLYAAVGLTEDRIRVLPFVTPTYIRQVEFDVAEARVASYGLEGAFLFYPAQFWPHKNHVRLVQALGRLRDRQDLRIPLVLAGSSSGRLRRATYKKVVSAAIEAGVDDQVRWLGYLPDEDMASFYRAAVGLVMPTFFGPTNIPILEAWSLDCPVITSDIRGVRDQAGDAALLVDPASVDSIAEGLLRLWTDQGLRHHLVHEGRKQLERYTPEDFRNRLVAILTEAEQRLTG